MLERAKEVNVRGNGRNMEFRVLSSPQLHVSAPPVKFLNNEK